MRTRIDHGHHDHVAGKDVEHGQGADHVVFGRVKQRAAQPAVIDDPRIAMLRDLGHAGGAAGMEIGGNPVTRAVGKGQRLGLARQFGVEILDIGMMVAGVLGAHKRHDPGFRRSQVAIEIHLKHRVHAGGMAHRFGGLLRHVGLGERLERDDDLGLGLAQDGADLFRLKQRIDRVDDPRNGTAEDGQNRLVAVGQDASDHIALTDAEAAEQVRRLTGLFMQLRPVECFGLVGRTAEQLERDGLAQRDLVTRLAQHLIKGLGHVAFGPWHLGFKRDRICDRCKTHLGPPLGTAMAARTSSSVDNVEGISSGYKSEAAKMA